MTSFLQTCLQDHSTIQQSKHGCSLSAFPSAISICVGFFCGFCSPSSFQSPQYLGHLLLVLLHSLSQAGRCDQKHIHSSWVINSYIFTEVIQKNALQKHNTLGIDRQLSSHIFIQTVPLPFSDFIFNLRAFFFPKIKIKKIACLERVKEGWSWRSYFFCSWVNPVGNQCNSKGFFFFPTKHVSQLMFIWNSVYFRKAEEMEQSINYLKCLALILQGLRYMLNFTTALKPEPLSHRHRPWSGWKRKCTDRHFQPKTSSAGGWMRAGSRAGLTLGCSRHGPTKAKGPGPGTGLHQANECLGRGGHRLHLGPLQQKYWSASPEKKNRYKDSICINDMLYRNRSADDIQDLRSELKWRNAFICYAELN